MADFATSQDVADRWRLLTPDEHSRATVRLGDASALLRRFMPGIDDRIAADTTGTLAQVARSAAADAVIRFLRNPEGAKSLQETIGPRSYGLTFEGGASGLFFTEDELAPLRPSAPAPSPHISFSVPMAP